MSLKKWVNENRLTQHKTSREEIQNLLKLVERDLQDANIDALSDDRRFITAYNAALQLATCVLYSAGYRTRASQGGHHWISFAVLPDILSDDVGDYADYFDSCRVKRNVSDYTSAGQVSRGEAEELIEEVVKFRNIVINWIERTCPEYV